MASLPPHTPGIISKDTNLELELRDLSSGEGKKEEKTQSLKKDMKYSHTTSGGALLQSSTLAEAVESPPESAATLLQDKNSKSHAISSDNGVGIDGGHDLKKRKNLGFTDNTSSLYNTMPEESGKIQLKNADTPLIDKRTIKDRGDSLGMAVAAESVSPGNLLPRSNIDAEKKEPIKAKLNHAVSPLKAGVIIKDWKLALQTAVSSYRGITFDDQANGGCTLKLDNVALFELNVTPTIPPANVTNPASKKMHLEPQAQKQTLSLIIHPELLEPKSEKLGKDIMQGVLGSFKDDEKLIVNFHSEEGAKAFFKLFADHLDRIDPEFTFSPDSVEPAVETAIRASFRESSGNNKVVNNKI